MDQPTASPGGERPAHREQQPPSGDQAGEQAGEQSEPMSLGRRLGYLPPDASPIPLKASDVNFFGHGDELDLIDFKLPRSIGLLTWGALSWDPRELPLLSEDPERPEQAWQPGGPEVPIEFSRVAVDCRLLPVIDPINGVPVPTLWARSRRNDLTAAIDDLLRAEGAKNRKLIGFVDTADNKHRCLAHMAMAEPVKAWARAHGLDCVVWSELPANFQNHTGRPFSPEAAVTYLRELPRALAEQAREYVDRAPACVDTPLRRKLAAGGWPALP